MTAEISARYEILLITGKIRPDFESVGLVLFSYGFLARNQHSLESPTRRLCAWNRWTRPEKHVIWQISLLNPRGLT